MDIILARHEQASLAFLMQRLKKHQRQGEKAYLFVPEQFTLQSDIHLLEALEIEATIDIKVKSFTSLAREVLDRLGNGGLEPLNELGRSFILRFLIEKHRDELAIFGHGHIGQGVITALAETLGECKGANIRPMSLATESESGLVGDLLSRKLHDVSILLAAYEERIAGRYLDNEDQLGALRDAINQAAWLSDISFYFYGFHGFTALEYEIIEALLAMGVSLTFAVPLPADINRRQKDDLLTHEALAVAIPYWERLQAMAGSSMQLYDADDLREIHADLAALADAAFSWKHQQKLQEAPHLRLQQGISSVQEVTTCAQDIRYRVMREGARYRDFSIAVTAPDEYIPLIRRIFKQHDIPVFIDQKRYLSDNPLIRAVMVLLELLESPLRRETVMAYIKQGFTAIERSDGFALDRHSQRRVLRGQMFFEERYYQVDPVPYQGRNKALIRAEIEAEKARRAAKQLEVEIGDLYQSVQREERVDTFARLLYHFLSTGTFHDSLEQFQNDIEEAHYLDLQKENQQVIESFVQLLEQLVAALGDEVMSFHAFADLLRHGLSESSSGIIPPAKDQVLAGTLGRTRSHRTAYQYILGMSDAWLPAREGQRTIFLGTEKEQLADLGLSLLSLPQKLHADEMMALYQSFTRPTQSLILSWPLSDSSGQSMNQSRLIGHICDLLSEHPVESLLKKEQALMAYSVPVFLHKTMKEVRRYRDGANAESAHWVKVGSGYAALLGHGDRYSSFLQAGLSAGHLREALTPTLAKKLYPAFSRHHTSITELEQFRQCPYRHFIRYGLRPTLDEVNMMERREAGTMLHEVFAKLTETLKADVEAFREETTVRNFIHHQVHQEGRAVLGDERLDSPKNTALMYKVERVAQHAGKHILRQLESGQFRPFFQELHFGEHHGPQLLMHLGDETVVLEGAIDRIDAYEDRLRIVDYKTGQKSFDLSRAWDGLDLQLLLYLRVALGLNKGLRPAGIFYLNLKDEFALMEDDDQKVLEDALMEAVMMDGLIINDPEVLAAMDVHLEEGKSTVLRFRGRKRDLMEKDNVMTEDALMRLVEHAELKALEACRDILDGVIDILPARIKDQRVCTYCDYAGICRIEENGADRPVPIVSYDILEQKEENDA